MNRKYVLLRDRECSSMVSTWDALLCVGFGSVRSYKLYLGTFEVLGERAECYDEEADEYVLPDHINGTPVKGFKDDAVIGYEVESASYRPEDEFEFDNPSECEGWLSETQWLDDRLLADLRAALVKLDKPITGIDKPNPSTSRF
jgi:hypothetical protein